MNKIFSCFLKTELVKEYSENYDIIYIDLVGSRRSKILDDVSDYDIEILVIDKNTSDLHKNYKNHILEGPFGERLHWYLHDFKQIVNSNSYYYFVWAMSSYLRSKQMDNYFLYNDKYYQLLNFLNENSFFFFKNALNRLTKEDEFFNSYLEAEFIDEKLYSKNIYRYVLGWYILNDELISDEERYFLNKIKRIRWLDKNYKSTKEFEDFKAKALLKIKELNEYFKNISQEESDNKMNSLVLEYENLVKSTI